MFLLLLIVVLQYLKIITLCLLASTAITVNAAAAIINPIKAHINVIPVVVIY
jgi:hypothetical protein